VKTAILQAHWSSWGAISTPAHYRWISLVGCCETIERQQCPIAAASTVQRFAQAPMARRQIYIIKLSQILPSGKKIWDSFMNPQAGARHLNDGIRREGKTRYESHEVDKFSARRVRYLPNHA
jgi:hypothetical protein